MSFQQILEKYRKISYSERDKGDRFERLIQLYLKTDPKYAFKFKEVWMWDEFHGKDDLGGNDTGIDLVALTNDGEYWAIQCKCYQEDSYIDKPAVDSFLSTSSREFINDLYATKFSHRLWISTTNKWSANATEAIKNQNPPVTRLNLFDLIEAPVDWGKLEEGIHGEKSRTPKHALRPHQKEALEKAHEYFKENDRGKLIMACGTGKTFNSLRIAEHETNGKGLILLLVPSIALLGQTLSAWSAHANEPINPVCICSDPKISRKKKKNEDTNTYSIIDLALPASTNTSNILYQFEQIKENGYPGMTVVFSTYQSIGVIAKAQKELLSNGYKEFDMIICDEAHRTTGVTLSGYDESAFVKVHDNNFIKAKKRLYMTATPRLFSDDSKSKAAEADAVLCSMDDADMYGEEIYRIGFGEAVEKNLLTDYKVLILTLNDKDIPPAVQNIIASGESEIKTVDVSKLVGCVNALSKQFLGDDGKTKEIDPNPMKRAVAFCSNIAVSKTISGTFNTASDAYLTSLPMEKKEEMVTVESQHMDGTMTAPERDEMLSWLKSPTEDNECRVITNVRVLSEGVDVPSLDAVMFLSARNSQVDVVQSVGRVMRRAEGKKYGYIIIPVVVPADVAADKALDDNERYKVVWTVLNALRAHDDRFNATVNKIDLNKRRPAQILVGRPEYSFNGDGNSNMVKEDSPAYGQSSKIAEQLSLQFEQLQNVIFARMVQKVGDRKYWEDWAKEVAIIAERQIERIAYLVENRIDQRNAFNNFLTGLQKNINPSISKSEAIEMLAQHIITKPIFEALFEDYSFVKNNAVSSAMQAMLDALQDKSLTEESATLQKFYESVKRNISDLDNANAKQKIIIRIYDDFFKTAFPKMVEQLGIVYTPVDVVDFIIHSVEDVLQKEFDRSISDENIHILDPFTGTGTFITRLLQSGLIKKEDLHRKYHHELHANEIVLLAYYIAAVNIENAYHDQLDDEHDYQSFDGIVLTDTFQLGETDNREKLFSEMFPQNSERVENQKKAPVRVIIGNPPYSIGQKSANDNAQNQFYANLDKRISDTYANESTGGTTRSLYDAYIKAFRWSTDRLDKKHGGMIAFVSNGAWLDSNSADGFRKVIEKEFSSIWVFNLRGNQRTSGELSRKEGGKIFGSGSRTPISITLLVKNPKSTNKKATIHYYDIGDYLSREEKLAIVKKFHSIDNPKMKWKSLKPNEHGDWINQRNDIFDTYLPIQPKKKFEIRTQSFFTTFSLGVGTNRDAWCYNNSYCLLSDSIQKTIGFYNNQREKYNNEKDITIKAKNYVVFNSQKANWTSEWIKKIESNYLINFDSKNIVKGVYRPFFKQNLYFSRDLNSRVYQIPTFFPKSNTENILICISCVGANQGLAVLITDKIPNLHFNGDSQCFPLYYYEESSNTQLSMFDSNKNTDYVRKDGVSDFILSRAKKQYGKNVCKEDIFYYVYGILHSEDYRTTFANDLKKMLPRIPLVEDVRDFWKFSKAGRALADLHINYESVPAYEDVEVTGEESEFFKVQKMRFAKVKKEVKDKMKSVDEKSTIHYNSQITIKNIPDKAYEYVVNGKSAIEWIMERYQVKIDKKSGIKNDPNDWADEVGNPRYILDLLLSIINVSVQTVDIVNGLPKLEFE